MARPERKTVDYFPHYISDGKKMFFIEHKYGNDGYATWFKLLEILASTENHYLLLENEADVLYVSAKCRILPDVLLSIIDDLCTIGEINKTAWSKKILWSDRFIESIQDAYSRRTNKCITYDGLCMLFPSLCSTETPLDVKKTYRNPQSKVNEIKVNERIENSLMSEVETSNVPENEIDYFNVANAFFELFKQNASELGVRWKHLETLTYKNAITPIRLLATTDNRTRDEMLIVFEFLKKDDFWKQNIQSTKKLREKFDQLITKASTYGKPTSNNWKPVQTYDNSVWDEYVPLDKYR